MAKRFFVGWPLWEKLCFVLACAIVLVAILGAIKLAYTHWRLRKYTAVAEKEKREQTIQRQMSVRRRHDEVPFGIRALERGVEVEGVWISRPNTPERKSKDSSGCSLRLQQLQRASQDTDIEKQLAPIHQRGGPRSNAASQTTTNSAYDRAVSAERLSYGRASRDSSIEISVARPPSSQLPPCSFSKYDTRPYAHRTSARSVSRDTLEAEQRASLEAIRRASTSIHQDDRSGSDESSHSGNDNDSIAASAPRLFTSHPAPRPRQPSLDLQMMHSHRISQVAETGQLTPRQTRAPYSADWSDPSLPKGAIEPRGDYFTSHPKAGSSTPSDSMSPTNPFATPKIDTLPAAVRRSSMPEGVTPFSQFCKRAPPSPTLESSRPASQAGAFSVRQLSDVHEVQSAVLPKVPVKPAVTSPAAPTAPQAPASAPLESTRSSFEKRASRVVRGHGSGFEILRPGSLNPQLPSEHPLERQRAAAPPVSLHNAYKPRSSSAGTAGRKLQKKRRQSFGSTTSSESSGRKSRNSVL